MAKFRKKPIIIEAEQWFKNGDHSKDGKETFIDNEGDVSLKEGKVVRYFRHPDVPGTNVCRYCILTMHFHGWIDTLEGGHIVCPGDWIVTGVKNEKYPVKPGIFDMTYEKIFKTCENPRCRTQFEENGSSYCDKCYLDYDFTW